MKIIITGATGFVGSHFVRHFYHKGHEILAVGRAKNPPKNLLKYAKWKQVDIENFKGELIGDVMIHAAGMAKDKGNKASFFKTNVQGTLNMYHAFKGKHFIYISSASVYDNGTEVCNEMDVMTHSADHFYGQSKLESERQLALKQSSDKKITILRPRAIYGTHDRVLLPRMLNLVKGGRVLIPGDMNISISMTHIENLIYGIEVVIENEESNFEIYNIADRQVYILRDVVNSLLNTIYDRELIFFHLPLKLVDRLVVFCELLRIPISLSRQSLDYISKPCIMDTNKISKKLNFKPARDFYSALPLMQKWVQKVGIEKVKVAAPELSWT